MIHYIDDYYEGLSHLQKYHVTKHKLLKIHLWLSFMFNIRITLTKLYAYEYVVQTTSINKNHLNFHSK